MAELNIFGYSVQNFISSHNLIYHSNSSCSPSCYSENNKITCGKSLSAASAEVLKEILGYRSVQREKNSPQETSLKHKIISVFNSKKYHYLLPFFVNWPEKGMDFYERIHKKFILLRQKKTLTNC